MFKRVSYIPRLWGGGITLSTAAALQKSSTILHERGTWNARDDRTPTAVWLAIFWVGIIAGFSVDLRRYFHENPPAPFILNVHAVVFTIWLLIFTAQVLQILGNRVAWHRRFGWFAAAWTCLMAVLGPWAALDSLAVNLHTPGFSSSFLAVNIVDIAGFLIFIGWGLTQRKNPAAHKRLMMLAMVAIADPGFSRFTGNLMKEPTSVLPWFVYMFYGNVALIILMAVWDWRNGRLMRQFVLGSTALVIALGAASILYFWQPWKDLTLIWVQAWARVML